MHKISFKLIISILLLSVAAIAGSTSCRRASDNGKIDGYWQIREIYYIADGTAVNPTDKFIAIQLELLQLQSPSPSPALTGVLSYHKGDDSFSVDFRNNPTDEQLYKFGFQGKQSTLHIDKADCKNLVISSPIAVITCKKY